MSTIDALYIYDDQNNPIVAHIYKSRPPSAQDLLSLYRSHPAPRPSLLYLPEASPPTTVFSVHYNNLLFLIPSRHDVDPVAVLEYLHRVIDVFEEFLGSPLLSSKIETNYDVVAQLLIEMCDAGIISNTESNALRDSVETQGAIGKLLTGIGLPGSAPAIGSSGSLGSSLKPSPLNGGLAIPWRRQNVRHTSNELYVDIVETLSVILAPSGRPISAISNGSIVFTAKVSGVPDLALSLSAPGGTSSDKTSGISRAFQLPTFHPCVRLARWKDRPGELSFVPPDGKFILAGYEVDLLPTPADGDTAPSSNEKVFLPANVDMKTGLGPNGLDFEVRLTLNTDFPGSSASRPAPRSGRSGTSTPSFPVTNPFSGSGSGNSNTPVLENVVVSIPIPTTIRNVLDLRPSRGEASFSLWDRTLEWRVPTKDGASVNGTATLCGTVVGPMEMAIGQGEDEEVVNGTTATNNPLSGYYDEDSAAAAEPYQSTSPSRAKKVPSTKNITASASGTLAQQKRIESNKALMPRSVTVSFGVRGWLPSGIKVESLLVDTARSKGLGDGVKPYKGVKYLTVSKKGVERRV